MTTFKAMVISELEDGTFARTIRQRKTADLPDGEVLVRVHWSSLNYKDALSSTGNRGVTRSYPHTPGIDASGIVEESTDDRFRPGDAVIVTSYDLGMNTDGGFGEYIRVPADWVVPLPEKLSLRDAMIIGTAGLTAAMCVWEIVDAGVRPEDGEILVSGASGGVGSVAVALLGKLGYAVAAGSRKANSEDYLLGLGASRVVASHDLVDTSGRPMLKPLWAASVDTVGGELLATTVKSTGKPGVIACCGNVAGMDLPVNIFPFILRGVRLVGIDSQNCAMAHRSRLWSLLAGDWRLPEDESMVTEVGLEGVSGAVDAILKGDCLGRTLIRM